MGFTCGHTFTVRELTKTVLPRLERKLVELQLPASARLLLADYGLPRPSVACPNCVLHFVQSEIAGKAM